MATEERESQAEGWSTDRNMAQVITGRGDANDVLRKLWTLANRRKGKERLRRPVSLRKRLFLRLCA